ncbi:transcription antitermination protein NusB [Candidatus Gracilibacteria bacterium]|nr:transcription antitermination protein NusB [Candidatus Gracilibacteria bacterium]
MGKISRHKTRKCLFQALYSKIYITEQFDKNSLFESFFEEGFSDVVDQEYFDEMFDGIIKNEAELIYIVERFAPKFNIKSMSTVNIIPIFIASYEILYLKCDKIPEKVSIDEALEITKIYSDNNGRIFVNGVINSIKDNKKEIKKELKNIKTGKTYFFNKKTGPEI